MGWHGPRGTCGCCNAVDCDWDCTIPDPACITASACGHTVILDEPNLLSRVVGGLNECYYEGCAGIALSIQTGDTINCFLDERPEEGQIVLCPEDPDGGYLEPDLQVIDADYYFTCAREGSICVRVTFDPSSPGRLKFLVTVTIQARVYLNGTGTIDHYDAPCPEYTIDDVTFDFTESFTVDQLLIDTFDWSNTFEQTYDIDCEDFLGEYTVDETFDAGVVDIAGTYLDAVPIGACTLTYDFGDLSCNDFEAIVNLASGPCA